MTVGKNIIDFYYNLVIKFLLRISNLDYVTSLIGTLALATLSKGNTIRVDSEAWKLMKLIFHNLNKTKNSNEMNKYLKEIFLMCRRKAVTQKREQEDLLNNLSRKTLWQFSAGHKTLCTAGDEQVEEKEKEWMNLFKPDQKTFSEMIQRSNPIYNSGITIHTSQTLTPPVNRKWVKRGGCFDVSLMEGGNLTSLRKFIHKDDLTALMELSPYEQIRKLPDVYSKIYESCMKHLRNEFPEESINYCPIGYNDPEGNIIVECECKHPYLLSLMVLNSPPGKVRMCTMNMTAIAYVQTQLQKALTWAMKQTLPAIEGLSSRPNFPGQLEDALLTKYTRECYIHSGDLTDCTNRFIPYISKDLCKILLDAYNIEIKDLEYVLNLCFGSFKIIQSNAATTGMRSGKISDYEDLLDYSENNIWFKNIIGQHLSMPVSFPNMATMHAIAYAKLNPPIQDIFNLQLMSEEMTQTSRQLLRNAMKVDPGREYPYFIGVENTGKVFKDPWRKREPYLYDSIICFLHMCIRLEIPYRLEFMSIEALAAYDQHLYFFLLNNDRTGLKAENDLYAEYKKNLPLGDIKKEQQLIYTELGDQLDNYIKNELYTLSQYVDLDSKDRFFAIIYIQNSNKYKSDKRTYVSKQDLLYNVPPKGEVLITNTLVKYHDNSIKKINRNTYLWTVGDDHLHVTESMKQIKDYKKILTSQFNQKYNNKADFISKTGAVIAEHCMEINQKRKRVREVIFLRPKQLLEEFGNTTSWIDKLKSIYSFYSYNFRNRNSKENKFHQIKRAQELFILNHKKLYNKYKKQMVDPTLPANFGGLNIICEKSSWNKITYLHLQNLNYFWKAKHSLLFIYQKRLIKHLNPQPIKIKKYYKPWLKENLGTIPFSYHKAKQLLYKQSIASALAEDVIKEKRRDLSEIIRSSTTYIKLVNNIIKYELNKKENYGNKSQKFSDAIILIKKGKLEETYLAHQILYYIKPDGYDIYNLEDLSGLVDFPKSNIQDPRLIYLNHQAINELEAIEKIEFKEMQKIDKARLTREKLENFLPDCPMVPKFVLEGNLPFSL